MAYNQYPYGGYQPAPYYPGPVPDQLAQLRQSQMQQPMAQAQPVQTNIGPLSPAGGPQNNGIIWVSGKAEADSYLVAPNSAVALWDANNPVIYLRKADSTEVYDLVPRTDSQTAPGPQFDLNNVVTWDKLEEYLSERLKKPAKRDKQKEDAENG